LLMMAQVQSHQLSLLGGPRLERGGQSVPIERRKALALLAYLALSRQSQRRESLAAMFWPEAETSEGRAALRLGLVVFFFILSWFPLYTFNFAMYICQAYKRSCPVHDYLIKSAVLLSHLNSAWNPVLYAWAMTDFLDAFKALFGIESNRRRLEVCEI